MICKRIFFVKETLTPLPPYKAIQRFPFLSIVIPSGIPEILFFRRSNIILLLAEMNYIYYKFKSI